MPAVPQITLPKARKAACSSFPAVGGSKMASVLPLGNLYLPKASPVNAM